MKHVAVGSTMLVRDLAHVEEQRRRVRRVDGVNACALPRKDACINACGTAAPAGVDTIGACSKQTPPAVDVAVPACEWP